MPDFGGEYVGVSGGFDENEKFAKEFKEEIYNNIAIGSARFDKEYSSLKKSLDQLYSDELNRRGLKNISLSDLSENLQKDIMDKVDKTPEAKKIQAKMEARIKENKEFLMANHQELYDDFSKAVEEKRGGGRRDKRGVYFIATDNKFAREFALDNHNKFYEILNGERGVSGNVIDETTINKTEPEKIKEQVKEDAQKANEEKRRLKEARKAEKKREKEEKRLAKKEAKKRRQAEKKAAKKAKEALKAEYKAEKRRLKEGTKKQQTAPTNNEVATPAQTVPTNNAPAPEVTTPAQTAQTNSTPAPEVAATTQTAPTNNAPAPEVTTPAKEKIKIDDNVQWALNAVPSNVQVFMKENGMLEQGAKWMNSRQLGEYLKTAEFDKETADKLTQYLTDKSSRQKDFVAYMNQSRGGRQ